MDLPKRKPNRLRGWNYGQAGAYFITICTVGRQKLLGDIVGGDAYVAPRVQLSEFGKIVERYLTGITGIDQYVIMPNHVHMIVVIEAKPDGAMWASPPTKTTLQSIPQLIKSFKVLVAKETGHSIFQRSFYDHIIRSEQDYRKICEYLKTNPVKWNLDRFYQP